MDKPTGDIREHLFMVAVGLASRIIWAVIEKIFFRKRKKKPVKKENDCG